ncbi:TPA: hypothetical protein ACRRWA_001938 [Klebsiella quasipneumoniae]
MTTFTVEIQEDIVAWLKKGTRPEIVLDLPSVPEPGDKLWLKSMRDAHIVEMERCSCGIARCFTSATDRAIGIVVWYNNQS